MRAIRFALGTILLLVPEILRVYFIMPFPGSQEALATDSSQVDFAYFLHTNIWWIRLIGIALVSGPLVHYLRTGGWGKRLAVLLPVLLCGVVFYAFTFKFTADKMFLQVKHKTMLAQEVTQVNAGDLVIGIEHNGDARAYPIELIGYHHQVLDTIGGEPVLVTYCTVCRTGRVFSPKVNGVPETFRLVGMDHFNAMFEDGRTKSWWRQVSGECIEGALKGQQLEEIPSVQMSLGAWSDLHPNTLVLQPDPLYMDRYAGLKDYDDGSVKSGLEGRDTASWQMKSWVVGVVHNGAARAYDWNELQRVQQVHDTLGGDPVSVILKDAVDFVAILDIDTSRTLVDIHKGTSVVTRWTGPMAIPATQEFWHSWRTFHPNTSRYGMKE